MWSNLDLSHHLEYFCCEQIYSVEKVAKKHFPTFYHPSSNSHANSKNGTLVAENISPSWGLYLILWVVENMLVVEPYHRIAVYLKWELDHSFIWRRILKVKFWLVQCLVMTANSRDTKPTGYLVSSVWPLTSFCFHCDFYGNKMAKWMGLIFASFLFLLLTSEVGMIMFHWPEHGFILKARSQQSKEWRIHSWICWGLWKIQDCILITDKW